MGALSHRDIQKHPGGGPCQAAVSQMGFLESNYTRSGHGLSRGDPDTQCQAQGQALKMPKLLLLSLSRLSPIVT